MHSLTLRTGDAECIAEGHARRNTQDPNVPRIGEELATARALSALSGKLLEESAPLTPPVAAADPGPSTLQLTPTTATSATCHPPKVLISDP